MNVLDARSRSAGRSAGAPPDPTRGRRGHDTSHSRGDRRRLRRRPLIACVRWRGRILHDQHPDPSELPENLYDLFAAFEAGELRAQVLERIRSESEHASAPVADLSLARWRRRARTRRLIGAAAVIAAVVAAVAAVVFALTRWQAAGGRILFDAEVAAIRTGPSPRAEGGAEVFRLKDGYEVRLEMEGLAPTTGNRAYRLW
jgi:hypothetical protein